ncbi:hypothetical protein Q4512_07205 [Oceanihabitans sp. 2_MG-2023]|uniref:hypothetical protein n=1 Tax=Oceanihabitans sp. 2_MG-2023 TaxID=3062661 RepID=UPI0026E45E5A|nr:hypothetical protein [Oceanihabitans sp. 2_MG-2023]MDO6596697.1 hypothetical protein [Oceanihabitans sp. 2_MG-2023]
MKNVLLTYCLCLFSILSFSKNKPASGLLFDYDVYEKTPTKAKNVAFQDADAKQPSTSLKEFVPEINNKSDYDAFLGGFSTKEFPLKHNTTRANIFVDPNKALISFINLDSQNMISIATKLETSLEKIQ